MNSNNISRTDSKSSLESSSVKNVLERLYNSSRKDHSRFIFRMIPYVIKKMLGQNPSFSDQYYNMVDLSLQFSPEHGIFAYNMARAIGAKRIVEFGTAFGYSTIYLASALKDNGGGVVIGSEFIEEKKTIAEKNIEDAGLSQFCDIRSGDAMESLADPGGEIDMILIDGSKDLYIPVLKMLYPFLKKGGVVLADNVTTPFIKKTLATYVEYMQNPENGFKSMTIPLPDGFEFSVKI